VRVVIPSVEIDATLMEVGVVEEGVAEVPPFGTAAWYKLGPAPGANGPAVLLGHVDSKRGPDVFYRLRDVKSGDRILVYGADGDVAIFSVDSREQVLKTDLPVERIWNQSRQSLIRLITCGGEFDPSTGHYLSNLIVYGHLVR
jgi:LPXTG-site transpeptidase (sortase) family protein